MHASRIAAHLASLSIAFDELTNSDDALCSKKRLGNAIFYDQHGNTLNLPPFDLQVYFFPFVTF